jgi:hypothetical protein
VWIQTGLLRGSTLVTTYKTTRCHSPEDCNQNCHCRKTPNLICVWTARPMTRLFFFPTSFYKAYFLLKSSLVGALFSSCRYMWNALLFPFRANNGSPDCLLPGPLLVGDHYFVHLSRTGIPNLFWMATHLTKLPRFRDTPLTVRPPPSTRLKKKIHNYIFIYIYCYLIISKAEFRLMTYFKT